MNKKSMHSKTYPSKMGMATIHYPSNRHSKTLNLRTFL